MEALKIIMRECLVTWLKPVTTELIKGSIGVTLIGFVVVIASLINFTICWLFEITFD